MNKKAYYVPPVMSRKIMVGGISLLNIGVVVLMIAIVITISLAVGVSALYWLVVPVIYGVMVWHPMNEPYSGVDFFKNVIHYLWTPQVYVLSSPFRKEGDQ